MKKTDLIEQLPGVRKVRDNHGRHNVTFSETVMRQIQTLMQGCQLKTAEKEARYPHAIFVGVQGSDKREAASLIAAKIDRPLFHIDLSQLVSKYIGETEKNLGLLFGLAEQRNCILLFDEADALFGKRTEVQDANDRYANLEVSFLLEQIEHFKGVVILACNQLQNIDDDLLRRFQFTVEFPSTKRDRILKKQQQLKE